MSLPILVALVAVGITIGVLAVHFTGGSKVAEIASDDQAKRLLIADFPQERPDRVHVTDDRHTAFMPLSSARVGIVQSFGDGFFTRIVSAGDVASVRVRDPAILSLRFRDFTWTGGNFHFVDRPLAESLAALLSKTGAERSGA